MSTGIMIAGPSGSGKSSLGKIVAEKLGFPYFDVDDYIWKKDTSAPYTQMYSKAEKIRLLKSGIEPYEHFVMAGSMSSFHQAFDDNFEMMVFLYAEPEIRLRRVHKRAMERFGKRILEGGDLYESHQKFLESNRRYESPELVQATEKLYDFFFAQTDKLKISREAANHLLRTYRAFLEGFSLLEIHNSFGNPIPIEESFNLSIDVMIKGMEQFEVK